MSFNYENEKLKTQANIDSSLVRSQSLLTGVILRNQGQAPPGCAKRSRPPPSNDGRGPSPTDP